MNAFSVGDLVEHIDNKPGYIGVIKKLDKLMALVEWPNADGFVYIAHLKHAEHRVKAGDQIGVAGHSGVFVHLRPHVATYKPTKPAGCPDYYWFDGVEVKQISRHLTSNGGQALQYIARATRLDGADKGEHVKDLTKALAFIQDEITRLEGKQA